MKDRMTEEELDILERFERGELRPVANEEKEIQWAREAAQKDL